MPAQKHVHFGVFFRKSPKAARHQGVNTIATKFGGWGVFHIYQLCLKEACLKEAE